jgi:RimJ/RimL family protein N-acetyltransferase
MLKPIIRPAQVDDAEEVLKLFKLLDLESSFMLFEAGERKTTIEQQAKKIESFRTESHIELFVAVVNDAIVGLAGAHGGHVNRNKHSLSIAIGVAREFGGQGIGHELMMAIDVWAKANAFHRLELSVMSHNIVAQKLYLKCGFVREGVKSHSLKVNGEYVDEWLMAKLI